MSRLSIVAISFLALLSAVTAATFGLSGRAPMAEVQNGSASVPSTLPDPRVDLLRRDLTGLKQQVSSLRQDQSTHAQALEALVGLAEERRDPEDDTGHDAAAVPGPAQSQASTELTRSTLGQRLESERIDGAWAQGAVRSIEDAFTRLAAEGVSLKAIDCRTTLCRLELVYESITARERLAGDIPRLAAWDAEGFVSLRDGVDGSPGAEVYITRSGTPLQVPAR